MMRLSNNQTHLYNGRMRNRWKRPTATLNQKKETFTVIPAMPIESQRLNTEKLLLTWDVQKGDRNTEVVSKREMTWVDSNLVKKR